MNQDFFCKSALQGTIRPYCTDLAMMKSFDPGMDTDKTDRHRLHQVMHVLCPCDCNALWESQMCLSKINRK